MSSRFGNLRAALNELHTALDSLKNVDAEARELLVSAVEDIHRALERRAGNELEDSEAAELGLGDDSVLGPLRASAQHFEESHPTLAGMIGSVINALAQLGI